MIKSVWFVQFDDPVPSSSDPHKKSFKKDPLRNRQYLSIFLNKNFIEYLMDVAQPDVKPLAKVIHTPL